MDLSFSNLFIIFEYKFWKAMNESCVAEIPFDLQIIQKFERVKIHLFARNMNIEIIKCECTL